jgi:hypothetical protein
VKVRGLGSCLESRSGYFLIGGSVILFNQEELGGSRWVFKVALFKLLIDSTSISKGIYWFEFGGIRITGGTNFEYIDLISSLIEATSA